MASKRRHAVPLNPALAGSAGPGVAAPGSIAAPPGVGAPFPGTMPTQPMAQPVAPGMMPVVPPVGAGFAQPTAPPTGQMTAAMGAMSLGAAPAAPAGYSAPQAQNFAQPQYQAQPSPMMAAQSPMAQASMLINPAYQCPREWMRTTLNAIPQNTDLATKSQVPLGVIVHPMAEVPDKEIPVVDFGTVGIVRCNQCRAYVNPFVRFVEGGRRWQCNICNRLNEVPPGYYSPVGADGQRTDLAQRVELQSGIVEFMASSEYMFRPPQPPTYLFLIDVSYYAVSTGMLKVAAETIYRCLDALPGDSRTKVGIVTYDSKLHVYDLSQSRPHMQVIADVSEPFVPPGQEFLVDLKEKIDVLKTLLQKLPLMFSDTKDTQSCLGTALKSSYQIMRHIGGKLILFNTLLPAPPSVQGQNLGKGRLNDRFDAKLIGTDKEVELLRSQNAFYKDFALECSQVQISVDLFLFETLKYLDVATLGVMSQVTGGELFYYPHFNLAKDGEKFSRDLIRDLTRPTGFEAVMRVRCSKGIRVLSHFGNLFLRRSDLIALPNIDSDKAFAVQFELEENITGTPLAYSQAALLYTTSNGERRIRVMNLAIPVTNQLIDIFTSADVEAIVNLMGKMAIEKILDTNIKDAREALVNKLATMLSVYRVAAAGRVTGAAAGQLMTPDSLRQLPLFILALIKSEMMKTANDIHPDYRASLMMRYRTLGIRQSLQCLYPSLYRVHPMEPTAGLRVPVDEEDEDEEEEDVPMTVTLPTQLNLSSEKYDRRGIFLLDNGDELLVLAGKSSHPDEVLAIFGRNDYGVCEVRKVEDPNSLQARLGAIVDTLRESKPGQWARMTLIPEDSPAARRWFNYLVEDRQQNVYSYFEFVQHVNNVVMQKTSK